MTLHEALAAQGYTTRKERDDQRRTVYNAQGQRIASFTAAECWQYLRRQQPRTEPPRPEPCHICGSRADCDCGWKPRP